jgi:hypothetical protein
MAKRAFRQTLLAFASRPAGPSNLQSGDPRRFHRTAHWTPSGGCPTRRHGFAPTTSQTLSTHESSWRIVIDTHRAQSVGRETINCAILLSLAGDEAARADEQRALWSVVEGPVRQCLATLIAGPFVLQVDLPDDTEFRRATTSVISDEIELNALFEFIRAEARNELLHPFSVWVIPTARHFEASEAVADFQSNPGEGTLFDKVLELGALRIAVWRHSIDVSTPSERFEMICNIIGSALIPVRERLQWLSEDAPPPELQALFARSR